MKRQLLESHYRFTLNDSEMERVRSSGNTVRVINRINQLGGVRGITFTGDQINVVIEAEEGNNVIEYVEKIITEELL